MGAQSLLQLDSPLTIMKPNISKHAAVHVVFDYDATIQRPTESDSALAGRGTSARGAQTLYTPSTTDKDPLKTKSFTLDTPSMHRNDASPTVNVEAVEEVQSSPSPSPPPQEPPLVWDWDIEHEDRRRERKADLNLRDTAPFEVDRRLLKDVVREKMGIEVGRIKFLSAGTFHKAYLVTLVNREDLVARVARRFMPRLKTESEVATLSYLREKTTVPVPRIYHYDSSPYNRLGGEFILMSKAPGIPLSKVYHGLSYNDLVKLVKNLASIVVQLFAHRFTDIGSLYFGPDPRTQALASGTPTPRAALQHYSGFPFSPTLDRTPSVQSVHKVMHDYHVGPIISWPFFGSNRGELVHPTELDRGPWPKTKSYLASCVEREIDGIARENAGSAAPHRLHLDPDEIQSSRHHKLRAVPGDESDDSDEYDLEESEEEWEGPGSAMYRDYRRNQRSTFLVAHLAQREQAVRREMGRWKDMMERLVTQVGKENTREEFGLDCHDLSLENVFVDDQDHSKITCVIDWESTTTRPLWATAHIPTCLQSSPFVSKLFRTAVEELPSDPDFHIPLPPSHPLHHHPSTRNGRNGSPASTIDAAQLCKEWLYYEAAGARLRMAHRCAEWDGWEEGLVESILGPEELEAEWFKFGMTSYDHEALKAMIASPRHHEHDHEEVGLGASLSSSIKDRRRTNGGLCQAAVGGGTLVVGAGLPGRAGSANARSGGLVGVSTAVRKVAGAPLSSSSLPFIAEEKQKEKMLNHTGDICGGRGGELGRRLEAWLTVTGGNEVEETQKWNGEHEEHDVEHQHFQGDNHHGPIPVGIGIVGR